MSLITKIIPLLWWILAPALVAKLLISITTLFIHDKALQAPQEKHTKAAYIYSLPRFFTTTLKQKVEPKRVTTTESLGSLKLKACYVEKGREFVIISESTKTVFIDLLESYKGIKLIKIKQNSAIFLKDGEQIELTLTKKQSITNNKHKQKKEPATDDRFISVQRVSFDAYTKDPQKALKNIRFKEIKVDKKFAGFKLSFIRKGSLFDRMKLKKGDIIKYIDGNELKSMMDLLPYYNLLENTTSISIGFLRDGAIKEIMYEIN